VLNRVPNQVRKHLRDTIAIPLSMDVALAREEQASRTLPFQFRQHLPAKRHEIDRRPDHRYLLSEARARQVEQVTDHPVHPARAVQYALAGDVDVLVVSLGPHQHGRAQDDARQGIA
jgi:hypothetical protein